MIARLVALYLAIFAVVLAALSTVAYLFIGAQYHSLLLPALSTPEGAHVYASAMRRVATTIVAFDIPLLVLVGFASWGLARVSIAPWTAARERERQFIADAAHELRSPLATISSLAQASRRATEHEMRDALDSIAKNALDTNALISDLLTLARSPSASLLQREPVDLAALARECVHEFDARAAEARITVTSDLQSAIVNGDARRLRELLRNLLENALRHAHTRISVTCATEGSRARLIVTDDGSGIAPELRDRIFERFFKSGTSGGTGLGLAIARWVAAAHDGSIALAASSDGARFVTDLPAVPLE